MMASNTQIKVTTARQTWYMRTFIMIQKILTRWEYFPFLSLLLLVIDALLSTGIIKRVSYTEIDWKAYMQEVQGFLDGELDYRKLRGDTGPLVYPAGFVYLYSLLYYITDNGTNIRLAQWIFQGLYLTVQGIVLALYYEAKAAPPWTVILLFLSKRIHSIFMLRLFNDCFAAALAYFAILQFSRHRWRFGCIIFSLAVSIKMNVLLYAPGLLLLLLRNQSIKQTFHHLFVCGGIQVFLGAPFLLSHMDSYISKAFEFSRVFSYTWTVNWKILSPTFFQDKRFAVFLLACHLLALSIFVVRWARAHSISETSNIRSNKSKKDQNSHKQDSAAFIVACLFISHFTGIVFSRTLHYQFYVWYFHTIPLLCFIGWNSIVTHIFETRQRFFYLSTLVAVLTIGFVEFARRFVKASIYNDGIAAILIGLILIIVWKLGHFAIGRSLITAGVCFANITLIEFAFNVFPATAFSSILLHIGHLPLLLILLYYVDPNNLNSLPAQTNHVKVD